MLHRLERFVAAAVLCCTLTMASHVQAAVIIADGDTYIRNGGNAANNFGNVVNAIANLSGTDVRMALFRFDLSAVPPGTIAQAKLELVDVIGNATQPYEVWGLLDAFESFNEATLTWNTATFLNGSNIDTTKVFGGAKLGDFSNVMNSLNTVFDVTSGNFLNFLNASSNNSVTFVIVDPNSNGAGSGWATKENTVAQKPTLTLTAAVPEPSTWALLGSASLFAIGALRRRRDI